MRRADFYLGVAVLTGMAAACFGVMFYAMYLESLPRC